MDNLFPLYISEFEKLDSWVDRHQSCHFNSMTYQGCKTGPRVQCSTLKGN